MERKMETDKKMREMTKNSDDPLDAFMKQVKSGKALDSITRSKMHREKAEIQKQIAKFDKLAKLSAPADFSQALQTVKLKSKKRLDLNGQFKDEDKKNKMQQNLLNRMKTGKRRFGVTGMSTGKKTTSQPPKTIQKTTISSNKSEDFVEHDSDEGKTIISREFEVNEYSECKDEPKTIKLFDKKVEKPLPPKPQKTVVPKQATNDKVSEKLKSNPVTDKLPEKPQESPKPKRAKMSATIIPGMFEESYKEEYSINATDGADSEKKIRQQKKIDQKKTAKAMKNFDQTYQESAEYSTWVPPTSELFNKFSQLFTRFLFKTNLVMERQI